MIELKIDDKVLPALQRAFPTPSGRARRALSNYVKALRERLIQSLCRGQSPIETKMNLFSLSLHELANAGGQIGKQRVRVHAWLRDNGLSLVEPVVIGSNLTGMVSKVKFTDLVELKWHEPEVDANHTVVDGVKFSNNLINDLGQRNEEVFNLLYKDISVCLDDNRFDDVFDAVDIDVTSLQNYIAWLQCEARHYAANKKSHYLFQARLILAVAQHTSGSYYQRRIKSDFGRTYYEGTSVQNVNKELRYAMLGDCWEYDIRSSVVAWKMGFGNAYISKQMPTSTVAKEFVMTLAYLRDKSAFMKNVQSAVFEKDCDLSEDFQVKLLKQAFTALSFGARKTGKGWMNKNGEWQNPSLVDIFKRVDERNRFLQDAHVEGFAAEQAKLDTFLYQTTVVQYPDLLKLPYLQTHSGRPSKPKIVAFLYQHEETEVMNIVRAALAEHGKVVLANIHDAIVVRQRLGADLKHEIELRMQEQTNNAYWSLGVKQIHRWNTSMKEIQAQGKVHHQRIAEEEALATGYASHWARDSANDDYNK